jgi:glucokinase
MSDVCITIDFGGTNIKLGIAKDGHIIDRMQLPAYSGQGLLSRLGDTETAIRQLLEQGGLQLEDCAGIGIAMPGIVDSSLNKVLSIHEKYEDAIGYSFVDWARVAFGLPVAMENDARAAIIGETSYGAAKGVRDAVLMTFGTGIGTAAMIDGHALTGKHYQAGILGGHFTTDARGPLCNCGNRGCLEEHASHRTLRTRLLSREGYGDSVLALSDTIDYKSIIDAAAEGDRFGETMLQELILHWSAGIVSLIHAYDPDTVILSGGLMKSSELLLPLIREKVYSHAWTPWGKVNMVTSHDPDSSVLLGLSAIVRAASQTDSKTNQRGRQR